MKVNHYSNQTMWKKRCITFTDRQTIVVVVVVVVALLINYCNCYDGHALDDDDGFPSSVQVSAMIHNYHYMYTPFPICCNDIYTDSIYSERNE